ncbi:MAG TPA: hypothetical protein VF449_05625 [Parvibaculum sp.]
MSKLSHIFLVLALALAPTAAFAGGGMTVGKALSTGPAITQPLFVGPGFFSGDPPPPGMTCHKVVRDGPTADNRMAHWSATQCYDAAGRPYIVGGSERIDGYY